MIESHCSRSIREIVRPEITQHGSFARHPPETHDDSRQSGQNKIDSASRRTKPLIGPSSDITNAIAPAQRPMKLIVELCLVPNVILSTGSRVCGGENGF